jgi:hypothetical protein
MKVPDVKAQRKLEQIQKEFEGKLAEAEKWSANANSGKAEGQRETIASLRKQLKEWDSWLGELQNEVFAEYKAETNNAPQRYEDLPLEEQKGREEAYHNKIDYKSLEKLQDNLDKINALLLDRSGDLEHDELLSTATIGAQANANSDADRSTLSP